MYYGFIHIYLASTFKKRGFFEGKLAQKKEEQVIKKP